MLATKHETNVKRRGKRRSEPRHPMKADNNNNNNNNNKPTIWRTIDDAKRKQEMIRNRVRRYGDEEEDSGYGGSPYLHNGGENSESDSDEYDDDFDLSTPASIRSNLEERNTTVPQKFFGPPTGNPPTRKKSFSNAVHSRSLNFHGSERSVNSLIDKESLQQSRSDFLNPARKHPLHSGKGDKLPALTPEEAIKLVMERHTYVSDSERTDDPDPVLSRKASLSTSTNGTAMNTVHSTSTTETAMNTVASSSSHNRTPEGKRVLVLKKKKPRADTHPRTSKNKNYHQRNLSQDRHRRYSRQEGNGGYRLPSERRKEQQEQHKYSSSRVQGAHSKTMESTRPARPGSSRPHEYSSSIYQQSANKENGKHQEQKMGKSPDTFYRDEYHDARVFGNGQVEDNDRKRASLNKHFQASKGHSEDCNNPSNTKAKLGLSPDALEDMTEKEIIIFDISENDHASDSESDRNDRDCWGGHEDNTQRPSNRSTTVDTTKDVTIESMLEKQDDKDRDDDIDSLAGQEEDWRNMSWKTARTSKSVLSKYSKSSSVALWMKNMGEADSGIIEEDDIYFFDAIQEAGKTSSSESVSTTDNTNDDALAPTEEEGWRGRITNFVGYTIGAFTGSTDEGDGRCADNDGIRTAPVRPPILPPGNPTLPVKSSHSSGSNKAVPSRELEIIRKCQELMTSNRNLMETRKRDAARRSAEDIRLQRMEDLARAKVRREVIAYREMMEGLGKGAKLAPLDRKIAAQDYDDRLAMVKTLEDQEKKMRMHERNMMEMDGIGKAGKAKNCCCSCTIS